MPSSTTRYAPAARLLQIRTILTNGATLDDLAERLGVAKRTAKRCLEALEASGEPVCEEMNGKTKVWRLARERGASDAPPATTSEALALALSRHVSAFLEGTGFEDDLDAVVARVESTLPKKKLDAARVLTKRIHVVREPAQVFDGRAEDVDAIVTALVNDERLDVRHVTVDKGDKTFVFEPYALVVYKRGLYLLGMSKHHAAMRQLSLDGVVDVDRRKTDRFEYPGDFDLKAYYRNTFGIIRGPREHVVIRFDRKLARYLKRGSYHVSQTVEVTDRAVMLTMDVDGTVEVRNWVLGFGAMAEVLEPRALREEIAAEARKMVALYAPKD
jgi:predicted DNA-binding transcriptional regulator YafY